jgi:hypothetical protein
MFVSNEIRMSNKECGMDEKKALGEQKRRNQGLTNRRPRNQRPRNQGPRNQRRGATMVESAMILVPLLAIFLALMDFSLYLFAKNTLLHAVREGCRYGVTGRFATGFGQVDSIKQVVIGQSMGFISDPDKITVEFFNAETMAAEVGPGSNAAGNVLKVSIRGFEWELVAPLLREGGALDINVASSDIIEPSVSGGAPVL